MLDDPFSPRNPPRKPPQAPQRPSLWADGGQKPKFDLRAFARASLHLTREGVAPVLAKTATVTAELGDTVASGKYRVPQDRWGRSGRFLPSYGRVAGWIGGVAGVLAQAGTTAMPDLQPPTAPAPTGPAPSAELVMPRRPQTRRTASEPAPPTALPEPAVAPLPADDPLLAIRAVLAAETAPPPTPHVTATPQLTVARQGPHPVTLALIRATGTVLGWGVTGLALPYGAVRATLAHLGGEDLRQIGKDR